MTLTSLSLFTTPQLNKKTTLVHCRDKPRKLWLLKKGGNSALASAVGNVALLRHNYSHYTEQ